MRNLHIKFCSVGGDSDPDAEGEGNGSTTAGISAAISAGMAAIAAAAEAAGTGPGEGAPGSGNSPADLAATELTEAEITGAVIGTETSPDDLNAVQAPATEDAEVEVEEATATSVAPAAASIALITQQQASLSQEATSVTSSGVPSQAEVENSIAGQTTETTSASTAQDLNNPDNEPGGANTLSGVGSSGTVNEDNQNVNATPGSETSINQAESGQTTDLTGEQANQSAEDDDAESEVALATEDSDQSETSQAIEAAIASVTAKGLTVHPNVALQLQQPGNVVNGQLTEQGMIALQQAISQGGVGSMSVLGGLGGVGMSISQAIDLAAETNAPDGQTGHSLLNMFSNTMTPQQLAFQLHQSEIATEFSPNAAIAIQAAGTILGSVIGGIPGMVMSALSNPTSQSSINQIMGFLNGEDDGGLDFEIDFTGESGTQLGFVGDIGDFDLGDFPDGPVDIVGEAPLVVTELTHIGDGPSDDSITFGDLGITDPGDLSGGAGTILPGDSGQDGIAASVAAIRRRILSEGFGATNIHTGSQGLGGTSVNKRLHSLTGS